MTLSVGLIGAGGIGGTHAENLRNTEDAVLVAVCDLDRERAEEVASVGDAPDAGDSTEDAAGTDVSDADAAVYEDHQTMLETEELDAVYVTTPPRARVDILADVARSGAGIFCEKPLAATVEDGRRIVEIVEEYEVPFTVGFCLRYAEPLQRLREIVSDGTIGEPINFFTSRAGWGVPSGDNWRVDPGQTCGITIESTSHHLDLLRWLGGEIASASGRTTGFTHPELEAFDDNMVASVAFESGAIGSIRNSWTSHVEGFRHGVVGTEGTVVAEGDGWWRIDRLECVTESGEGDLAVEFDEETATDMGYRGETAAFVECVATGAEPSVGVRDGLRALELSYEILES